MAGRVNKKQSFIAAKKQAGHHTTGLLSSVQDISSF
jgi:hypothetical protein